MISLIMLRFRVVALVFSTFSTNGLGKAPSPPPWVTLNTSVSFRAIICAVDLGIVVGRFSGKVISGALRKVTKKLVPSLLWFLKGSVGEDFFELGNCAQKNWYFKT